MADSRRTPPAASHRAADAEEMVQAFRAAGCRMTDQRRMIIETLVGRDDHPSARQLYHELHGHTSGLSLATVYNTLATMVELGLLAELEFEAADNRYDTNLTPHLNLVCTRCGDILDVPQDAPLCPDEIRRRTGFEVRGGIRMECRGVCRRCRSAPQGDR